MELTENLLTWSLAVSRLRAIPVNSHIYHVPQLQYNDRPEREANRQRPTDPIHYWAFTDHLIPISAIPQGMYRRYHVSPGNRKLEARCLLRRLPRLVMAYCGVAGWALEPMNLMQNLSVQVHINIMLRSYLDVLGIKLQPFFLIHQEFLDIFALIALKLNHLPHLRIIDNCAIASWAAKRSAGSSW